MFNRPTNIAMLSVHTSPVATLGGNKTGGMNVYVRELSKHLARCQINVDIFTRRQEPHSPQVIHIPDTDARVIQIDAGPHESLSPIEHTPYIAPFAEAVHDFTAQNNISYDVIHSHYWLSGLVGEILRDAWPTYTPLVQMFHTLGHMKRRIATHDTASDSHHRVEAEERIMASADRLIAATPAERLQMMWLYGADPNSIRVISPGVDTNRFSPAATSSARGMIGMPQDTFMVLFVGRIEPLKGIDSLIESATYIKGHNPELYHKLCIQIVGGSLDDIHHPNTEMGRLHKLAREYGVEDRVQFLGSKPQDELPNYYTAADALVMPSHYESFGMVALEAMASGTPVIASEVGGLAYLIQDGQTGFHVPYQAPSDIADRLMHLAANPDIAQALSQRASDYARQFSWEAVASRIFDVYTSAVNQPAA